MSPTLRPRTAPRWRPVTVPCDRPLSDRQARVLNIAWGVGRYQPKPLAKAGETIEQICSRIERRSAPGWPTAQMLHNARQSKSSQDPQVPTFDDISRQMAWGKADYDLVDDVAAVLYARWEIKHSESAPRRFAS